MINIRKIILFSRIKEDLLSTLSISAIQNTQIIMVRVNSVGTTSACDPASIFACPQCGMHHLVYMIYLCLPCTSRSVHQIAMIMNYPYSLPLFDVIMFIYDIQIYAKTLELFKHVIQLQNTSTCIMLQLNQFF